MNVLTRKKIRSLLFAVLGVLTCFSCSIDYSIPEAGESSKPEFMFRDVSFSRIEGKQEKVVLFADSIELYKGEDCMYGNNLSFVVYDDEGGVSVSGSCGLFSADTDKEEYVFYDEVNITSYEQDLRVEADNLRWNGKTEQLVSAGISPVRIFSGGFGNSDSSVSAELIGKGFSADGQGYVYRFADGVSGTIYTEDSDGAK